MNVYYSDGQVTLHHGDALDVARELPDGAADCIVTSPPYYGLRDYGTAYWADGNDPDCEHHGSKFCLLCGAIKKDPQYGLEPSSAEYVERMRGLFAELHRVLAGDGTLWLNIGDSYSSSPPGKTEHAFRSSTLGGRNNIDRSKFLPHKNMLGVPWRVAFALQDDGWILRNAIIWRKLAAMPESVRDRFSGRYEHIFLFAKQPRYYFDLDAVRVPASSSSVERAKTAHTVKPRGNSAHVPGEKREKFQSWDPKLDRGINPGDVWDLAPQPFPGAHFAVYPIQLPQRCIQAGCKPGGTVLDPFNGSGTTGLAAQKTGRKYIGIDINAEYLELTLRERLNNAALDFGEPA